MNNKRWSSESYHSGNAKGFRNSVPGTRGRNQYIFLFFLFFFSFLAAPRHMELPGQGSDPSHSHNQSHSCGNTGSFTHCAGPGIEPASRCSREAADPAAPQRELGGSRFMGMNLSSFSQTEEPCVPRGD